MTTLIAINTIHGQRVTGRKDPDDPKSKRLFAPAIVAPGEPFDPAQLGIGDEEAKSLVASGAARERGKLEAAAASPATDLTRHPPAGQDDLPSDDELEAMTRADLDDLAHKRGVDVSKAKNKGDVIDALVASVG